MEINAWHVQVEKLGNRLKDVNVQQDISSLEHVVKKLIQIDVHMCLTHFGMVYNVFVMKDLMLLGYNVLVMEL